MKKALLLLITILSLSVHAQKLWWVKTLSNTYNNVGLAKQTIDAEGNVYITKSYNFEVDVDPGPDSFKVVPSGINSMYLVKLGPNGNFLWAKQFKDPTQINDAKIGPSCIVIDENENIYITGIYSQKVDFDPGPGIAILNSYGYSCTFILKLDKDGKFKWVKDFSGGGSNASGIAIDKSGNIGLCGTFSKSADFDPGPGSFIMGNYNNSTSDIYIEKLDSEGNFLWAKQVGGPNDDIAKVVKFDSTGNVVIAGYFWQTADFDPGIGVYELTAQSEDAFFLKLDSAGEFVWAKRVGRSQPLSLAIDASQNIYATGIFASVADFDPGPGVFSMTANMDDAYVLKLNPMGDFVWAKKLGGSNSDKGCSITLDKKGNVYTAGEFYENADMDPGPGVLKLTSSSTYNPGMFICKLDSSGNFITAFGISPTESNAYNYTSSINLDISTNIYLSGVFHRSVNFDPGPGTYILNEINSAVYTVKLSQAPLCSWTGNINSSWENPGNWSCGVVPDFKTNVIIGPNATVIVNSNVIVNTLSIGAGTTFKVNNGYNLTVLH